MDNVVAGGAMNMMPLVFSFLLLVVGLVAWFFVNRASVRANQQIALMSVIVEQQKRQIALLRRLCEANEPESEASAEETPVAAAPAAGATAGNDDDLFRLVAER